MSVSVCGLFTVPLRDADWLSVLLWAGSVMLPVSSGPRFYSMGLLSAKSVKNNIIKK